MQIIFGPAQNIWDWHKTFSTNIKHFVTCKSTRHQSKLLSQKKMLADYEQIRRSLGHLLLHPLILRPRALQEAPAPADTKS